MEYLCHASEMYICQQLRLQDIVGKVSTIAEQRNFVYL